MFIYEIKVETRTIASQFTNKKILEEQMTLINTSLRASLSPLSLVRSDLISAYIKDKQASKLKEKKRKEKKKTHKN